MFSFPHLSSLLFHDEQNKLLSGFFINFPARNKQDYLYYICLELIHLEEDFKTSEGFSNRLDELQKQGAIKIFKN